MVVNGRALKRAKRRVSADLYDFLTFPGDGSLCDLDGPFRSNVRAFLERHARQPRLPSVLSPLLAGNLVTWSVAFSVGDPGGDDAPDPAAFVELDVVEEDVPRSRSVYCDQCRVVGWSGHPVCAKRYHFIIRNSCSPMSGSERPCTRCGAMLHFSELRCAACSCEMTAEDVEDWAYLQMENSSHLLHGVVHSNGYGHLLRVNGREGGSKLVTGADIMGFWDRLCKMLRVRKVTVMDMSKKYGLEYRLLHAVTTGSPWYGDWGYVFATGSYGVTAEMYHKAVETLSSTPLSLFFPHTRSPRTWLQDTIALYSSLSERRLETLRDLFCYMMDLLHDVRLQTQPGTFGSKDEQHSQTASDLQSMWKKEDMDRAENSILKVLQAVPRSSWVTWRSLRRALFGSVATTELLDYCLRGLGGKVADGGMIVAVRCNADTNAIEYRLEAVSNRLLPVKSQPCRPSVEHLIRDLKYLYDALLNPGTMHMFKPVAARQSVLSSSEKILDSKQFIKIYDEPASHWMSANPFCIHIWCHAELNGHPKNCTSPPPELLLLPESATVADLKIHASRAFREVYVLFQAFQAEQIADYGHACDATPLKFLFGLEGVVTIRGSLVGVNGVVRVRGEERRLWNYCKERGLDNWIVNCSCGAIDDDGERMLACDACEVWQHTRCAGISDFDEVPASFICIGCAAPSKPKGQANGRYKEGNQGSCKEGKLANGRHKEGNKGSSKEDSVAKASGSNNESNSKTSCKEHIVLALVSQEAKLGGHLTTVG